MIKLSRIADSRLHAALNKLSNAQMPLKTAFKFKGIMKIVREEFTKYDEVRKEAIQKHSIKNEDGSIKVDEYDNATFTDEGLQAFIVELNELGSLEIEVPTIKVSELNEDVNVTLEEVEILDGIIVSD